MVGFQKFWKLTAFIKAIENLGAPNFTQRWELCLSCSRKALQKLSYCPATGAIPSRSSLRLKILFCCTLLLVLYLYCIYTGGHLKIVQTIQERWLRVSHSWCTGAAMLLSDSGRDWEVLETPGVLSEHISKPIFAFLSTYQDIFDSLCLERSSVSNSWVWKIFTTFVFLAATF